MLRRRLLRLHQVRPNHTPATRLLAPFLALFLPFFFVNDCEYQRVSCLENILVLEVIPDLTDLIAQGCLQVPSRVRRERVRPQGLPWLQGRPRLQWARAVSQHASARHEPRCHAALQQQGRLRGLGAVPPRGKPRMFRRHSFTTVSRDARLRCPFLLLCVGSRAVWRRRRGLGTPFRCTGASATADGRSGSAATKRRRRSTLDQTSPSVDAPPEMTP